MKKLANVLMAFLNMATPILKLTSLHKTINYKNIFIKITIYFISLIFLITFYVFGCISLYSFLTVYYGETIAALSLCLLSLIITMCLILTAKRLKIKKKLPPPQLIPTLEKNIDQLFKMQDFQKMLKKNPSIVPITVVGAITLVSLFSFFRKKST